jgi:hypothetical protein
VSAGGIRLSPFIRAECAPSVPPLDLEELRVVDTSDWGWEHIIRQLERIKTDPGPRLT